MSAKQASSDTAVATVVITINGVSHHVQPGSGTAARIKAIGHVPPEDQLCQVISGQIKPLADDQVVEIQGGEVFVSHPQTGGSSWA